MLWEYDALNYWYIKEICKQIGERSENYENRKIAYQATPDLKSGKNWKRL